MANNKKRNKNSNRVYSTETGRVCPACLRPQADCICKQQHPTLVAVGDGIVRLKRETKGRSGKGVTLITGVHLPDDGLSKLAKLLKSKCGVGGSAKNGVIELQSSDREKIKLLLEKEGFEVKIAGG